MGAKTADQFLKEAYMAHYTTESYEKTPFYATHHEFLTKALRAYAESIREECAKVAEDINPGPSDFVEVSIARAIRSIEIK